MYEARLDRHRANAQRVEDAHTHVREADEARQERRVNGLIQHRLNYYTMLRPRFERDRQRQSSANASIV